MIIRFKKTTLALVAILLLVLPASQPMLAGEGSRAGMEPQSGESIFDQIAKSEVAEFSITVELDSLIQNKRSIDYRPASFSYQDPSGKSHHYDIKVKLRGKFRRKVCDFPPIKMKFPKNQLKAAGLSDMNELKLITHCLEDSDRSNDLVLREYLIYKMYNELTPNSLRVQLAKVTYVDVNNNKKITRWGVLLEDEEELVARRGAVLCDTMGQPVSKFNTAQERISSLFQYMIGNTDWSYELLRNVELVRIGDSKLIPVPYDFDFSTLVSAPYARPNSNVGQKSMRDRIFMGHSTSASELYSTFSLFRLKKQNMMNVVANFKYLDMETREAMLDYLYSFYAIIEKEETAQEIMFAKDF